MQPYFITGTDTDCGKTYVSCQLLDYFNQRGIRAQALKPLASGCEGNDTDVLRLQKHNADPALQINHWSFIPAIAPHIAAQQAGQVIDAESMWCFCQQQQFQRFERLLIEGAGGLLVPLNRQQSWVDFIKLAQTPVILVVGIKLGCINHALLTDALLNTHHLPYQGWIANRLQSKSAVDEEIISILQEKMHAPLLTNVQYYGKIVSFEE